MPDAQDGDLTICQSATEDIKGAADIVEHIHLARLLPEKLGVGLDPYAISALVDELATRKIEGEMRNPPEGECVLLCACFCLPYAPYPTK